MHIRNMVLRRVAQIELEADPALRRRLGHFVVIGGGFSGVETAGELVDCLHSIRRYYPRVADGELKVTLLQDQPPPLAGTVGTSRPRGTWSLAARGVDVRTDARATCVSDRAVRARRRRDHSRGNGHLHDRHAAESRWSSAWRCPPSADASSVNADLSVRRHTRHVGHWRLRARHQRRTTTSRRRRPRSSPCARRAASRQTCWQQSRHEPTRAFKHRSRGSMAAIGHRKGVADIFGIRALGLAGVAAVARLLPCRRCPRWAASCASSSNGPGACSSPTTSRTCASTAATSSTPFPTRPPPQRPDEDKPPRVRTCRKLVPRRSRTRHRPACYYSGPNDRSAMNQPSILHVIRSHYPNALSTAIRSLVSST